MRAKFVGKEQRTFLVRIRYGEGAAGARDRFMVLAKDEKARDAKRDRMAKMATDLAACGLRKDVKAVLDEAGLAPSDVVLSGIEEMVRSRCALALAKAGAAAAGRELELGGETTFAEVAELLFERQKRKGNSLKSIGRDRQRQRVVAPKLDKLPVSRITHAIARQAMDLVPPTVVAGRCLYEGLISRVLKHAVELGCIEATPLKPSFVSAQPEPKRLFQYLRVDEDRGLLSCREVLLGLRLAYGFMSRESPRPEFLSLFTWSDIDLESGLLTHLHKTPRVRRWQVCQRVLRVLRAWREKTDSERVFPDWDHRNIAAQLRKDLWTAGQRRRALHFDTSKERRLGMKDGGRATFVTLAKRAGAPQPWITDRTGHCTDEMLARYDRMARESQDTIRSWLTPLDELLGDELGLEPLDEPYVVPWLQGLPQAPSALWPTAGLAHELGQQLGQLLEMAKKNGGLGHPIVTSYYSPSSSAGSLTARNQAPSYPSKYTKEPLGPVDLEGVGQDHEPGGPRSRDATPRTRRNKAVAAPEPAANIVTSSPDPVEMALSHALTAASDAQQWDVVLVLRSDLAELRRTRRAIEVADELHRARREALAAVSAEPDTGIVSVADFRKRRDEGSK
jgi:hypothetical protein